MAEKITRSHSSGPRSLKIGMEDDLVWFEVESTSKRLEEKLNYLVWPYSKRPVHQVERFHPGVDGLGL